MHNECYTSLSQQHPQSHVFHLSTTYFQFIVGVLHASRKQSLCFFTADVMYMLHGCHQCLPVTTHMILPLPQSNCSCLCFTMHILQWQHSREFSMHKLHSSISAASLHIIISDGNTFPNSDSTPAVSITAVSTCRVTWCVVKYHCYSVRVFPPAMHQFLACDCKAVTHAIVINICLSVRLLQLQLQLQTCTQFTAKADQYQQ